MSSHELSCYNTKGPAGLEGLAQHSSWQPGRVLNPPQEQSSWQQASHLGEAIFMGYEFDQQSILFTEKEERREIPSGSADSVE